MWLQQAIGLLHYILLFGDSYPVMNVLIAFLLDAYQAHKDNFDTKNPMAFGISAQRRNSSNDEPWLKRLKRVSKTAA